MRTFLTKTSQKKIKLINFLLEAEGWRTISEAQKYLGVSSKSILLYIKELVELFEQFHGKIILRNDNNQRFLIQKEEDFPMYSIYLPYYKESYNYQLIDFMFKQPEKKLEDFAENQYTSTSTVFRYAKLLVPYFKRYNLTFHSYKLEIEGAETEIRSFYYYFYWDSTRDGGWPFLVGRNQVKEYIAEFEFVYDIKLDALQKKIFSYWLAIIIGRAKTNCLQLDKSVKETIAGDAAFNLIVAWLKRIQLDLPDEESYFLYRVIYAFGIIDGSKPYESAAAEAHEKSRSLAYRSAILLRAALKQGYDFDLDLTDKTTLFNLIAFHERSYFLFGNPDIFFNKSYPTELEKLDPHLYLEVKHFYDLVQQLAPDDLLSSLKNVNQLFLNYYYLLDYLGVLMKNLFPIKILITDDLHHTHRLWLMNKIRVLFSNSYAISFFDYDTAFEEVDLVISNYYLDTKGTPLLLMKNIPTPRNWRNLEQVLYQLNKTIGKQNP
nr:helix-turn-helix domain-containing protein [Enterococcus pallens]